MTTHRYHALLQWDSESGVWVTYVPILNGLSTFGETREEALDNTREAILGYLEAARKEQMNLGEMLASLPRLTPEEADSFAEDLRQARVELNRFHARDPWGV
jgi:predicted RNase H-like HicB family nuclease